MNEYFRIVKYFYS